MKRAIISAQAESEARFYDIDPMNVVWHGNYPRFLELGRVAVLDLIDYGYAAMEASGYGWPVIEMNIRYAHPIILRQKVVISAGITEWQNRLKIDFEIRDKQTGKRLSKASTVHVAVEIASGNMVWETPAILHDKIKAALG